MRNINSALAKVPRERVGLERKLEDLLRRRRLLVGIVLLSLHLVLTCRLAMEKIIWTDEFFTLYLSRLVSWSDLSSALMTGGDQHPPLFYLIHALFLRMFGESDLALRLPEILAFALMSVCLYHFVARRTSAAYGLTAMAVPFVTVAHSYAFEARGYGLVLGFFALAVLCWQQLGERVWRAASAMGLAVGLAAALGSHYYAVLLFPAVALAEIVRCVRRKTWDPLVWLAMCVPAVTLAFCYPFIHAATSFAPSFWAKPEWVQVHAFYRDVMGPGVTSIGAGLALAGVYAALSIRFQKLDISPRQFVHIEELFLAGALAAAPVLGVAVGKTLTNAFTLRYAMGAVIGITILFSLCCFTLFRGSAVAASLLILAIAAWFTASRFHRVQFLQVERSELQDLIRRLDSEGSASTPIVTGSSDLFYKISYYSPTERKGRYIFLADTERAQKYLGHDTVDRSLLALNPWFGLRVERYGEYIARETEYMAFSDLNPVWDWLPSALLDDNRQLRVVRRKGPLLLFSVSSR
jgi:hypothetical protein